MICVVEFVGLICVIWMKCSNSILFCAYDEDMPIWCLSESSDLSWRCLWSAPNFFPAFPASYFWNATCCSEHSNALSRCPVWINCIKFIWMYDSFCRNCECVCIHIHTRTHTHTHTHTHTQHEHAYWFSRVYIVTEDDTHRANCLWKATRNKSVSWVVL